MPLLQRRFLPGGDRIGRRLTVAQLLPALDGGGVERGTLEIAEALVAADARSIVISAGGRLVQPLVDAGSEHIELAIGRKAPWVLRHARRLREIFTTRSVDVVHARSRLPAWIAWQALRKMPEPPRFVTTLHGLNSVSRYSAIMTRGEAVIAVSDTARAYWLANFPDLDPLRVRIIHRGIDPADFPFGYQLPPDRKRELQARFGLTGRERLVCLPGRIAAGKGHLDLVAALAALAALDPSVCGLIVGAGGQRALRRVEVAARRTGVADRLIFTGHLDDVRDAMALSEMVLSLSRKPESFGRTVAEALALGRPVIGYDHGGVGEILRELYPEGRIAVGDRRALSERIARFMDQAPTVPDRQPYLKSRMQSETLSLYRNLTETSDVEKDPQPG